MADEIYLSTINGNLCITRIKAGTPDEVARIWAKTLFELTRTDEDRDTHFDPDLHTFDAIQAGLPNHVPAFGVRQASESDLPAEAANRGIGPTYRDAWEDVGGTVSINLDKARVIHGDRLIRAVGLEASAGFALRIADSQSADDLRTVWPAGVTRVE